MDFSEKVNTNEVKLKNPTKLKKMNICQAVNNALDTALASDPEYFFAYSLFLAPTSLERTSSSEVCSDALLV
jgi:endo-1,4-beta-D-glucanase Y